MHTMTKWQSIHDVGIVPWKQPTDLCPKIAPTSPTQKPLDGQRFEQFPLGCMWYSNLDTTKLGNYRPQDQRHGDDVFAPRESMWSLASSDRSHQVESNDGMHLAKELR